MLTKELASGITRVVLVEMAVDFLALYHRVVQFALLLGWPIAILLEEWWLLALVVFFQLVAYGVFRMLRWSLRRLSPRALRDPLMRARDDLKDEYERLDLPTGPLAVLKFVWRLARGKRPHTALLERLTDSPGRIEAIADRALVEAGEPRGLAALRRDSSVA